jgi:uncharacterized membrane protein YoaK (UPF0700 family)
MSANDLHMPETLEHPAPVPTWLVWLPPLLAVIAGAVDVTGYLRLGHLFTAHVTGNLVVIAALLVRGGPPNVAQVLAVPCFIGAVAAVWLIAKASGRSDLALVRPLLVIQLLLLSCALALSVTLGRTAGPNGLPTGVIAMVAVAAMASQFALLRLAVPGAPSTAVMTGNLTNAALSLPDTLAQKRSLMPASPERLRRTVTLLVCFLGGCVLGASAVSLMDNWAWSLPVVLAGAAVLWR